MKRIVQKMNFRKLGLTALLLSSTLGLSAQTSVFDVIAGSPDHTSLEAALIQEGLDVTLDDNSGTFTVFAPNDLAFTNLATALGTDITGLLNLPNLTDILTYHVLGSIVPSSVVTNGEIVQPLSLTNTLKLTVTDELGTVFVNQGQVIAPDLPADNGVVHSLDAVVLPYETVVDIAIDNGFNSLAAAVIYAELMPVLTDPLATYTVFAPTDQAFENLAAWVGVQENGVAYDLSELLTPEVTPIELMADVLAYHVIGTSSVLAADLLNGDIVTPLSLSNNLKITVKATGDAFVNQAQITGTDIVAENGVVHILDEVVVPFETVVDVAIDNGFTTLTTAVITAELLPALTDPYNLFTVFAPTNDAFDALATELGTDLTGILALPNLADVLLYHVVSGDVESGDLVNGPVPTLNGSDIIVDLSNGVMINDAMVSLPDVEAENGMVHVIDGVLLPPTAGINKNELNGFDIFPNPTADFINVKVEYFDLKDVSILNNVGQVVKITPLTSNETRINVLDLAPGNYTIGVQGQGKSKYERLVITSLK